MGSTVTPTGGPKGGTSPTAAPSRGKKDGPKPANEPRVKRGDDGMVRTDSKAGLNDVTSGGGNETPTIADVLKLRVLSSGLDRLCSGHGRAVVTITGDPEGKAQIGVKFSGVEVVDEKKVRTAKTIIEARARGMIDGAGIKLESGKKYDDVVLLF